jgi:hypothetical protein
MPATSVNNNNLLALIDLAIAPAAVSALNIKCMTFFI